MWPIPGILTPFHTSHKGFIAGTLEHKLGKIGRVGTLSRLMEESKIDAAGRGFTKREILVNVIADEFRSKSIKF